MAFLFSLGQVVSTPAALEALLDAGVNPNKLLIRHASGDWGDLSQSDKDENNFSVKNGYRILSVYKVKESEDNSDCVKVWIITEADRSTTTILLPNELGEYYE